MPTPAKPPPEHDVTQLVLGLFAWLRDAGHTTAVVPARARRGIATALSDGRLAGLAKTIATAFLIALDTWIYCATPQMRDKYQLSAKRELASTLDSWVRDDEHRSEAIRVLQAFPLPRLSTLIAQIAQSSVERAVLPAGLKEDQQRIRDTWLRDSELLSEILRDLEQKLRAPRGVTFPRTLKEWTQFEQALVQRLRKAGLSYGEIAKLRRSAGTQAAVLAALRFGCKRAGLRIIGSHVLRHTFCSHLAMRGAAPKAIQELAGHSTLSMTLRYMHLAPSALCEAIELLDFGQPVGSALSTAV